RCESALLNPDDQRKPQFSSLQLRDDHPPRSEEAEPQRSNLPEHRKRAVGDECALGKDLWCIVEDGQGDSDQYEMFDCEHGSSHHLKVGAFWIERLVQSQHVGRPNQTTAARTLANSKGGD